MSVAAGMGAFGFWIFVAAIVVAGMWYDAKRKESQQETLRRIVESGREIDQSVIDRVIGASELEKQAQDLKVAAYIVLPIAPGMLIMAFFIGMIAEEARMALTGVSFLLLCIGGGLYAAARYVERNTAATP